MLRLLRIFHTFTFRLGLVYVGLFSFSAMILFGFIYTYATHYIDDQISDAIHVRVEMLRNEYRENGSVGLEARLKELIASDDDGAEIYLLVNNKNEHLSGNLNEWPQFAVPGGAYEKDGQWMRFFIQNTRDQFGSIAVKAVSLPLSKWRTLLVGQSQQSLRNVEHTIIQAFWASLLLISGMAILGAAVMTRSVMRRLSIINRSADTIMQGALSTRIPFNRSGDEFDELSHNLNRMLDRIEALLQSLSQFASNIAHDLRSPLQRIVARTEAGLRGMKETTAARRLLEKNVADMQELIGTFNSILKITALEANTDISAFEPCDLSAILTHLAEFYEPYATEKHIRLECNLPTLPAILGEKNLLTQAFSNLLDNAIKFAPEQSVVLVHARTNTHEQRDTIDITVSDCGPGIPEEYRSKVFEKFFRLESSRHTRGNGLGLSLVAAIARMHSADITLSDHAPGLIVTISFPAP